MTDRWLTLEELMEELRLPRQTVVRLIREGKLYGMGHQRRPGSKRYEHWRFLSPSPRYRQMLEASEKILAGNYQANLLETPLLSTADLAAITGVTQSTLRGLVHEGKLTPAKIGRYSLYTVEQVRSFLLHRERKEPTDRRARCEALIAWCLLMLKKNPVKAMTREAVRNDDRLEGHLQKLLRQKEPQRSLSIREFWRRYQVAKDVAAILKAASANPAPAGQEPLGNAPCES